MHQPDASAGRSERACPVCGQRTLAIDEPPRIDVMGVQPYSELIGMGDLTLRRVPGIVCLTCGTRWRDLAAFEAGDAEPARIEEGPSEPGEDEDAEKGLAEEP